MASKRGSSNHNKITAYWKPQTTEVTSYDIARGIVNDLVNDLDETLFRGKKKHDGTQVSAKTRQTWEAKYPWLQYVTDDDRLLLKCSTCTNAKLHNIWATDGSPNVQLSNLQRHNDSNEHRDACKRLELSKASVFVADQPDSNHSSVSTEEVNLFRTVYYVAKAEIPNDKVNGLLELQSMNGVSMKYRNLSWVTITDIQHAICSVITKSIISDVNSSPVFALMLDESTDLTVEKRLSICIRYVKGGEPVTKFLCNVPIDDGCSHTIVRCVHDQLEAQGIDMTKCASLATDGAAAMVGKHKGVGVQIQSKYSPFCVQTHCFAHRLNLACSDSIKKNEHLTKFRDKFSALYFFMKASSARTLTLKKIQTLLLEPELSIKEPHTIRWLGLKNAVEAVYASYESVLATLSHFANEGNATAKGLYKYFRNYKLALMVAFMLDTHTEVGVLSCNLQKNNIMFSEIQPLMDGTLAALEHMNSNDGQYLQEMKASLTVEDGKATLKGQEMLYHQNMMSEFENVRSDYMKQFRKNIKDRFRKADSQIFDDLSKVLEPVTTNSVTEKESDEAVDHLQTYFGYEKKVKIVEGDLQVEGLVDRERTVPPLLDGPKLSSEWPRLKGMLKGSYSKLDTKQLCKRIILLHKDLFPNFAIMAAVALVIQVTSVECERSFSSQNRLKNKYRSSLGADKLNTLLQITMCGPEMQEFDPSPAISVWKAAKKRRTGRLVQGYKQRSPKKQKVC